MDALCNDTKHAVYEFLDIKDKLRLYPTMQMTRPSQKVVSQHMLESCAFMTEKGAKMRAIGTSDLDDVAHLIRIMIPTHKDLEHVVKVVTDDMRDKNPCSRTRRILRLTYELYWVTWQPINRHTML